MLDRLSFLNDVYAQNPVFRNLNNQLVNGVPIETGQTNVNIVNPSTYHSFMGRIDHRLGNNDNLTAALLPEQAQGRERDQQLRVRGRRSAATRT